MKQHRRQSFRFALRRLFAFHGPATAAKFGLCLLTLSLAFGDLPARDRSPGRAYFEQAYEAEKETPADAIELYERAIAAGLGRELQKAARWRLFYLYRKSGEYGEALKVAAHLGSDKKLKNVLGDLYKEIAVIYKIPEESARHYALGLKQLARDREEESALYFERALRGNESNEALRSAITSRLMRRGQSGAALALLKKIGIDRAADQSAGKSEGGAAELARADLLVKLKRDTEARGVLLALARSSAAKSLDNAERSRLFYLLARISRRAKDPAATVRWFRLAAIEAREAGEDELQSRMQGLAAYELFRGGRKLQARSLLYGIPETEDESVKLLELVLRAEVEGDPSARLRLEEMAPRLRAGKQSYLVRQALRVAGKSSVQKNSKSREKQGESERRESRSKAGEEDRANKRKSEARTEPPAFWQREFRKAYGASLKIEVPKNHRLLLVRNTDSVQFHGYSRNSDRLRSRLQLGAPLEIPAQLDDASDLLRGLRGDFVLVIAPAPARHSDDEGEEPAEESSEDPGAEESPANKTTAPEGRGDAGGPARLPESIRLAQWNESRTFSDQAWLVVNLRSDGAGTLTVELEEFADRTRMPGYARGRVQAIEFDFKAAD